jgi:hypothetical protein
VGGVRSLGSCVRGDKRELNPISSFVVLELDHYLYIFEIALILAACKRVHQVDWKKVNGREKVQIVCLVKEIDSETRSHRGCPSAHLFDTTWGDSYGKYRASSASL